MSLAPLSPYVIIPAMPIAPNLALQTSPVLIPASSFAKPKRKPRARPKITHRYSDQELHFVKLILESDDKDLAFLSAGYKSNNVARDSWKLLHKPKIQALLSRRKEELARANGVDSPYVIDTLKAEIEHLRSNPERSAAASQAILRGAEILGKHLGMFVDRVQEDRNITITVERVG